LILRILCAWCGKVKQEGDTGGAISHGICPQCAEDVIMTRSDLVRMGMIAQRGNNDSNGGAPAQVG